MGKRIRCRDEDSGLKAEVRTESLRKKLLQAETETRSPEVLTLHSKSISFQVVSRFCFMADLVRNKEVLRTHSLAAAF